MDQTQRQVKLRSKSSHDEKRSSTCLENLSNEIFYEIFDYLDGYEIYRAFFNLNRRYQSILSSSVLRLKINLLPFLDADIQHDCMQIISQQRHKIISVRLMYSSNINQFFQLMTLNPSFSSLQSLTLIGTQFNDLFQSLSLLTLLPCLHSLILCVGFNLKEFSNMYQLIFSFPVLKSVTLSSEVYQPIIPLPIATHDGFSSIEYLNIDHTCSLEDLIAILSFTPRLIGLSCKELTKANENINIDTAVVLSNLRRLRIHECYLVFDTFETFLKLIAAQLQILRVNSYWDATYLDADRWTQLISQYIPDLRALSLQHHEFIDDDFEVTEYHTLANRFMSSFWRARGFVFDVAIDVNDWSWTEIIYSIHSSRRKWYDIDPCLNRNNDSILATYKDLPGIDLTVTATLCRPCNELFTENIVTLFTLLRITRLDLSPSVIFVDILTNLIHYLPHLDSLKVWSLSLVKSPCIPNEQGSTLSSLSIDNKITKMNIQYVTELIHIQVLIDLCPHMQYREIGWSNDINFKSLLRLVLMKAVRHLPDLCLLCLCCQKVNDQMVQDLEDIVNEGKQRNDYIVKHTNNKIYLQWKRDELLND